VPWTPCSSIKPMTDTTSRVLGRTGVLVSPLTLGTMNFGRWQDGAENIRIIHAALDAGVTAVRGELGGSVRAERE
jgi:hypothetical protein